MPSVPTPKIKWVGGGVVLAGVIATIVAVGGPSGSNHGTTTCPLPAYPNASCTGYSGSLTTATLNGDGNLRVDANNAVVENVDVDGCIDVRGTGVTIRNVKAKCITTDQSTVASNAANPRLTIEDSEVDCQGQGVGAGIKYENISAYRVNVHNCENGLDMYRNMTLKDSYIHDLQQCVDVNCVEPSPHTDGIQSGDGSNDIIEHNTILAYNSPCSGSGGQCNGTSAININNSLAGPPTSNISIRFNLIGGGAFAMYCPRVATSNYVIEGNHFTTAYSDKVGAFGPSNSCSNETQVGNVYHESGLRITLP
jgi:hypothetical protein